MNLRNVIHYKNIGSLFYISLTSVNVKIGLLENCIELTHGNYLFHTELSSSEMS